MKLTQTNKPILLSICLLTSSNLFASEQGKPAIKWFTEQTPLTHAHQALLENRLQDAFGNMVEVAQNMPSDDQRESLDDILSQVIDIDCGQSFQQKALPDTIRFLRLSTQRTYTFGRLNLGLVVEVESKDEIRNFKLVEWPDDTIISSKTPKLRDIRHHQEEDEHLYQYRLETNIKAPPEPGLYQLSLSFKHGGSWNTDILIGSYRFSRSLVWLPNETWQIQHLALKKDLCPSPTLNIRVFADEKRTEPPVWGKEYVNNYPNQVPDTKLPAGHYWLELSLVNTRYQGGIRLDQTQKVIKNYVINPVKKSEIQKMFDDNMPNLTHEEQQKAVEKIQALMAQGIGSADAIKQVADEIKKQAEQDAQNK